MGRSPELFVGITSWNSERFLGPCLDALIATTRGVSTHIAVLDNASTDRSIDMARARGIEVEVRCCLQAEALNRLAQRSDGRYTLLIHADVVMLSERWFPLCKAHLAGNIALVSPEDIGCGPFTRPYGAGMPESSFLLFDTRAMRASRVIRWRGIGRLPFPERVVDFFGPHITHRLPERLRRRGLAWHAMTVHTSDQVSEPIYRPRAKATEWTGDLAYLRYGMGNFYSIDGCVTHYHNWYERVPSDVDMDSEQTTVGGGDGLPLAYVRRYTEIFLADYASGRLRIPTVENVARSDPSRSAP